MLRVSFVAHDREMTRSVIETEDRRAVREKEIVRKQKITFCYVTENGVDHVLDIMSDIQRSLLSLPLRWAHNFLANYRSSEVTNFVSHLFDCRKVQGEVSLIKTELLYQLVVNVPSLHIGVLTHFR